MTSSAETLNAGDLTTGSLCRIGILLSTCFWMPVALLMGLAAAMGYLAMEGIGTGSGWLTRFAVGVLQGVVASVANDIIIVIGAIIFSATRRLWTAPILRLRSRKRSRV